MKVIILYSFQHFGYVSPLAFLVSYEKSGVHHIRLPLHVVSCLHLAAYRIFFLAFSIFIVICGCESFLHLFYLEFIEPHQVCELSAVVFLNTLMLLYSSALFLVLTLHICYIDVLNGVHVCLRRFIYFSILLISGFQTV